MMKLSFSTFIFIYILSFTLAGVLLVLVRPPSMMSYIRSMVGFSVKNTTNLVIDKSLLTPSSISRMTSSNTDRTTMNSEQLQNNKMNSFLLVDDNSGIIQNFEPPHHHLEKDAEEQGYTEANDDDGTNAGSSSLSSGNNNNNKGKSASPSPKKSSSTSSSSSISYQQKLPEPNPISQETADQYIKYFQERRLPPKVRMVCPWNILIDYTFAFMIVDDFGVKYLPIDANFLTLLHAVCACVCVYFLLKSLKEVPIGGRGSQHNNTFANSLSNNNNRDDVDMNTRNSNNNGDEFDTPREELKMIMSASKNSNNKDDDNNEMVQDDEIDDKYRKQPPVNHHHTRVESISPSDNNPNNNNNSKSHSRILSTSTGNIIELRNTLKLEKEGLSKRKNFGGDTNELLEGTSSAAVTTIAAVDDNNNKNNMESTTAAKTMNANSSSSPSSSSINNNNNENNNSNKAMMMLGSPYGGGAGSSSFDMLCDENNDNGDETSAMIGDTTGDNNIMIIGVDGVESGSSSGSSGGASSPSTRYMIDPWFLKLAALSLFLRNFIDNCDGVMARQQRKMGRVKTGPLKDIPGHLIDAGADTFGAGICFIFSAYVLYHRRPVLFSPISRFLSRIGFRYHRHNPVRVGRFISVAGMLMMLATSAFWENFVVRYMYLFEPYVVRYAADLVPIEQNWALRINLYIWACVCGDSLLIMLVFCMYFDLLWEMAQYLFFVFAPILVITVVYSYWVWYQVVMKNPIAQMLHEIGPGDYKL